MKQSLFRGDILVAGLPRSGSTWFASKLAEILNMDYVHEPDNEKESIDGLIAKRRLRRFPGLAEAEYDAEYVKLWKSSLRRDFRLDFELVEQALRAKDYGSWREADRLTEKAILSNGSPLERVPSYKVVKSVHSVLCLPVVYEAGNFNKCIVIIRPLTAVVSSWLRNSMNDSLRAVEPFHSDYSKPVELCASDLNSVTKIMKKAEKMQSTLIEHARQIGAYIVDHSEIIKSPRSISENLIEALEIDLKSVTMLDNFVNDAILHARNNEISIVDKVEVVAHSLWREKYIAD